MFTVALIGPDGAGKTTIGTAVERSGRAPIKYIYMGINPAAANYSLPTTRLIKSTKKKLGVEDVPKASSRRRGGRLRFLRPVKEAVGLANQLAEEWFRQGVAWCFSCRGQVVLFDRHFLFDYCFSPETGAPMSWSRRVHTWALRRFFPRPDVVICLDAPAEVMFARKGECTLEELETMRQEYLLMGEHARHFAVVDSTQPQASVIEQVEEIIVGHYRRGGRSTPGSVEV
jgi:thymidylate kinase